MTDHRSTTITILSAAGLAVLAVACSDMPAGPSAPAPNGAPAAGLSQRAGDGNTPYRLAQAGWHCLNVPGHGVHCEDPHAEIGSNVHIQVKVFDTSEVGSDSAAFLGTESLVRADHYHGQPCLPGHGTYFLLPFGYYACHHFDF
jgi:hypothetical protein